MSRKSVSPRIEMKILRFPILLPCAAALLLSSSQVYPVAVVSAEKKEHSAHSTKPEFQYVCPMHEDVISKKPGLCRKCRMKLVKKPVRQEPAQ